ncbi:MAG: AsmA family protein [Bacteroidetes bacterium]|nr:AsmA family protein [Bacteroidota bacterium]
MNSWFRKILLGLFCVTVILVIVPWMLFSVYRDDVRIRIEKELDKQINANIFFEDIRLSLTRHFPDVTITLDKVEIVGVASFAGDTLAHVDEFDIAINPGSFLWGKEIDLNSIHFIKPAVNLKARLDGLTNFNILKGDTSQTDVKSTESINLAIEEIVIEDGRLSYQDERTGTHLDMDDLSYRGHGDFEKDIFDFVSQAHVGHMKFGNGGIVYLADKEVNIDLTIELNLPEKRYTVKQNNIRINHFSFALDGVVSKTEDGIVLDLKYGSAETEFKNIVSLIPGVFMRDFQHISTRGELAFQGFIRGNYSPQSGRWPSFSTKLSVKDGWFKLDTLPDPIENIRLEFELRNSTGNPDSTVIDISQFAFDMRNHPVAGRIKFIGKGSWIDVDVKAELDLSELERMYPVKGLDLGGTADFEFKARGSLEETDGVLKQLPVYYLNMKVGDARVKYEHLPAAVKNIHFHLIAENPSGAPELSSFDFRAIHADFDKNVLHGFARVEGYESFKIKSDLKFDLDLADLESMFPLDSLQLQGKLSLDVKSDGIFDKARGQFPIVDAQMELTNGRLLDKRYPAPVDNIHFSGELVNGTGLFKDTRLSIRRLTYNLDDEPFEVRGTLSNLEQYDYDLQIKGLVNLEKIAKLYPLTGIRLEGIIISDVETKGRLSDLEAGMYERTISNGQIEVRDLLIISPALRNRVAVKSALFTLSPSKIIIENMDGHFGKSSVSLTGDMYNYMAFATRTKDLIRCDLDLKADTLDVNEWLGNDASNVKQQGDSSVLSLWEVPKNLDMTFDSEIDHVIYDDMRISKLDGEIRVKDGVMTLHETGFNTLDAKFNISGDYDTRDMDHAAFDVDLSIKDLDINKAYRELHLVRQLASAAADTYGLFSLDYKLKGELKHDFTAKTETLVGGGEVRIQDAKVNGMKIFEELSKASKKQEINDPHLRDFTVKTEIRDNKIIVKPFSIRVSGMDADIEGVSEINGALRYLVKLEILHVKIPFHVTGTYDNPKVILGKGHVLNPSDSLSR